MVVCEVQHSRLLADVFLCGTEAAVARAEEPCVAHLSLRQVYLLLLRHHILPLDGVLDGRFQFRLLVTFPPRVRHHLAIYLPVAQPPSQGPSPYALAPEVAVFCLLKRQVEGWDIYLLNNPLDRLQRTVSSLYPSQGDVQQEASVNLSPRVAGRVPQDFRKHREFRCWLCGGKVYDDFASRFRLEGVNFVERQRRSVVSSQQAVERRRYRPHRLVVVDERDGDMVVSLLPSYADARVFHLPPQHVEPLRRPADRHFQFQIVTHVVCLFVLGKNLTCAKIRKKKRTKEIFNK